MLSRRIVPFARSLAAVLLLVAAACNGDSSFTPTPTPGGTLAIVGAVSGAAGDTTTLRSVVITSRGDSLPVTAVTYTSSDERIARVGANGLLTLLAPGRVTVTARASTLVATRDVEVREISGDLELTRVDGARLPLLVDADSVMWDGVREYHEVFIEGGRLALSGGTSPRYAVEIRYVEYAVSGPAGQRRYALRTVSYERDLGIVGRDPRGDLVMTSTVISPLAHTGTQEQGGVLMRFRIPGDVTVLQLDFRRPL